MAVWNSGICPKDGCASKVEDRTSRLMLVCSALFLGLCIRISALALKGEMRPCSIVSICIAAIELCQSCLILLLASHQGQ